MDTKPHHHKIIPVWFFVGLLLLVYGILILASGLMESGNAATTEAEKLKLAAPIWWGGVMTVFGGIYVAIFRPKK